MDSRCESSWQRALDCIVKILGLAVLYRALWVVIGVLFLGVLWVVANLSDYCLGGWQPGGVVSSVLGWGFVALWPAIGLLIGFAAARTWRLEVLPAVLVGLLSVMMLDGAHDGVIAGIPQDRTMQNEALMLMEAAIACPLGAFLGRIRREET